MASVLKFFCANWSVSNKHSEDIPVADLEGAQQVCTPLKFDQLCIFVLIKIPFCIRMLKNKAQIARESI